jgi:hypothetical protein
MRHKFKKSTLTKILLTFFPIIALAMLPKINLINFGLITLSYLAFYLFIDRLSQVILHKEGFTIHGRIKVKWEDIQKVEKIKTRDELMIYTSKAVLPFNFPLNVSNKRHFFDFIITNSPKSCPLNLYLQSNENY